MNESKNKKNVIAVSQHLTRHSNLLKTNVSYRIGDFSLKEEAENVKNLMFYISELEQKGADMFGWIKFTTRDFHKEFGVSKGRLNQSIENDREVSIDLMDSNNNNEKHLITNVMEAMLMGIASNTIPVSKKEGDDIVFDYIPIIKSIKLSSGARGERSYYLKVHEDYKKTFVVYYSKCNTEIFKSLKKKYPRTKGLQEVYMQLEFLKSLHLSKNANNEGKKYKKEVIAKGEFNLLVKAAGLTSYDKKNRKVRLIAIFDKINNVADILNAEGKNEEFDMEYRFGSEEGHRWEYVPYFKFKFKKETVEIRNAEENERRDRFSKMYYEELANEYKQNSDNYNCSLKEFIFDPKLERLGKKKIYAELYEKVYGEKPNPDFMLTNFG